MEPDGDVATPPASVRLRSFSDDNVDYRYTEFPVVQQLIGDPPALAGLPPMTSVSIATVFSPADSVVPADAAVSGTTKGISLAFDLINFDPAAPADFTAELDEVVISITDAPVLP